MPPRYVHGKNISRRSSSMKLSLGERQASRFVGLVERRLENLGVRPNTIGDVVRRLRGRLVGLGVLDADAGRAFEP
jgi:hypothetical protein